MLSMTGYGSASAKAGSATVTVEARAVNQRFLDVRVRLPPALAEHTGAIDDVARKLLVRGRIELGARLDGAPYATVKLDRERAKAALRDLNELRGELELSQPVPLSLLAALPGLFTEQASVDPEALRAAIKHAADSACRALSDMRREEGQALAADLQTRVADVLERSQELHARQGELRTAYRDKLRARIASLLEGTKTTLDEGRLEQEVALLADRSDVSEEITRLQSHCGQFAALLGPGEEPVGRKLEFLLQEMGREVNTLGSKVSDLRSMTAALELKAQLERMREQVQNVL
jgi:uncharacterized protein (TIGR00255 family)